MNVMNLLTENDGKFAVKHSDMLSRKYVTPAYHDLDSFNRDVIAMAPPELKGIVQSRHNTPSRHVTGNQHTGHFQYQVPEGSSGFAVTQTQPGTFASRDRFSRQPSRYSSRQQTTRYRISRSI